MAFGSFLMNYAYLYGSCIAVDLTTRVNETMVRNKKPVRRRSAAIAVKVPRQPVRRNNAPATPRPHRFRPGMRARMEIRKWRYRLPEKLLIRRLPFQRLVREIAQCYMHGPCFKPAAIEALHYVAEINLVKLFEDPNLLARYAKRITVYKTDKQLVRRIRGEIE